MDNLTTIVIGALVTILAGRGVWSFIADVMRRRNLKAEAESVHLQNKQIGVDLALSQAEGMERLLEKVKALINEKLETAAQLSSSQAETAAAKYMIQIRDGQLAENSRVLKEIIEEQGASKEREKNCQRQLAEIRAELESYGDVINTNRRLQRNNLQMAGTLDDLKRRGVWDGTLHEVDTDNDE